MERRRRPETTDASSSEALGERAASPLEEEHYCAVQSGYGWGSVCIKTLQTAQHWCSLTTSPL